MDTFLAGYCKIHVASCLRRRVSLAVAETNAELNANAQSGRAYDAATIFDIVTETNIKNEFTLTGKT